MYRIKIFYQCQRKNRNPKPVGFVFFANVHRVSLSPLLRRFAKSEVSGCTQEYEYQTRILHTRSRVVSDTGTPPEVGNVRNIE